MRFENHSNLHKSSIHVSPDYIILTIIYIGFFSVSRYVMRTDLMGGNISSKYIRLVCIALAFGVSIFVIFKKDNRITLKSSLIPLFMFSMVCLLSVFLSKFPSLSFLKTVEIFQAVMLAMIAISNRHSLSIDFLDFQIKVLLVLTIVLLAEGIIFKDRAWIEVRGGGVLLSHMLRGMYPTLNPNTVGMVGGLAAAAYFPRLLYSYESRIRYGAAFMLSSVLVFLSYSRSSMMALLVTILVGLLIYKRSFLVLAVLICILVAVAIFSISDVGEQFVLRGQDEDGLVDAFLETRGNAWYLLWNNSTKYFVGKGYQTGFMSIDADAVGIGRLGHAHNSLLQVLIDLGWLGVFAWLWMISSAIKGIFLLYRSNMYSSKRDMVTVICLMCFMLCKTISHSTLNSLTYDFLVFIAILVYIEREKSRLHDEPAMDSCQEGGRDVPWSRLEFYRNEL